MRTPPHGLRVERLRLGEHEILRWLYDAYLEELRGFGASYRRRPDGRWEYRPPGGDWGLDHLPYWLEPGAEHVVLIFRLGRERVGFAMVGLRGALWMSPGIDACISEFYVARAVRRRGIGEAAARRAFRRWPGRWEISEVPGNAPAIAFWRRTVERFSGGRYEELQLRGGPAQRFTSTAPRRRARHRSRPARRPRGAPRPPRATRTSRGVVRGRRGGSRAERPPPRSR
jgi:predicted acetyltransferase